MKYITLFEQQTAFDNAKSTLDKPNMSLVTETGNVYSLSVGGGVTYEYVDLGLSVKWAKCNVGAETETDYGDYFMWGSTKPNTADECKWANAPFNNGSNSYSKTYFNSIKGKVCPNGVLAKEYDAAAQIMGGDWRMPTQTEIQELLDNTSKEWTQVNGVNGYKFTSNKEGYQNNSIFIPAAGYYLNGSMYTVGYRGSIWISSLSDSTTGYGWDLYFNSSNCSMGYEHLCDGVSVRGVL